MHLVRAGGGFGRRLVSDYDIEVGSHRASVVTDERAAAGLPSVPVKLLWTREDDMAHDQYRPAGFHYFKAGLDASGKLVAYRDFVGQHRTPSCRPTSSREASSRTSRSLAEHVTPFNIPTGALRAPPTNGVSFVMQGFIDEMAVAAGQGSAAVPAGSAEQPVGRRRRRAGSIRRARAACSKPCATCRTGTTAAQLPKGTGMGVAFQFAHAGYVAYVVEVDGGREQGRVKVKRAWCAVDIGRQIVNPSQAENLVQGGFIEGMSHMMAGKSRSTRAAWCRSNFNQYQPTRMAQVARGDPGPVPRDGLRSDGARRAVAAAGRSGDHQRHLRGDRRSASDRCRWRSTATAGRDARCGSPPSPPSDS